MIRKSLLVLATLIAAMNFALAQVDVNKGDAAALDGIKGIGPAKSKQIIDERTKGGDFKDWADFQKRVKGIGDKSAAKLSQAGLQVNGKPKEGAEMTPAQVGGKAGKADKSGKLTPKTATSGTMDAAVPK